MSNIFSDADVIYTYTRAQAILDGVLVPAVDLTPDEPDFAAQAGFRCHVALTQALAAIVTPTDREAACGQDVKGRLWDLLNMARFGRPRPIPNNGAAWLFQCIFYLEGRPGFGRRSSRTFRLKAVLGGGDEGEPVLTLMLGEED